MDSSQIFRQAIPQSQCVATIFLYEDDEDGSSWKKQYNRHLLQNHVFSKFEDIPNQAGLSGAM